MPLCRWRVCVSGKPTMKKRQVPKQPTRNLLQSGLAHHRAGRLAQAAVCYGRLLSQNPHNADALHLSGVLARQEGRLDASERLIRSALQVNAGVSTYHYNLARTCALQGRRSEAKQSYRQAIRLNGRDADSMQMLAQLLEEASEAAEAIELCRKVLELAPDREAVYLHLGFLLKSRGEMPGALEMCRRAVTLFPNSSDSHFTLGKHLYEAGQPEECIPCYERVLALKPDDAEAHNCLGRVLHERGDLGLARQSYLRAVTLNPEFAEALSNLGALQMDAGEYKTGEAVLRRAIALKPDLWNAHCNLGSILARQGDALGAIAAFRNVLMVNPRDVATLCSLGFTLDALGDEAGAASCFRLALEVQPESSLARFNLSSHLLLEGNFAEGWHEYEQRWLVRQFAGKREPFAQPQWRGEPIRGKKIYVYAEQGLGDTLQFVRYVPMLAELGAEVILEVQPPLVALLEGLHPAVRVIVKGERPQEVDWHSPLLSLPGAFGTDLSNIPAPVAYLHTDTSKCADWSRRLATDSLRVGVVWTGNPEHTRDRLRSIPFSQFRRLTGVEGTTFYALQKGLTVAQREELAAAGKVVDLGAELEDFTDTAAIVANLDLVITVDTSVAHLAGALGKPVWILLPHAPDWRWLRERGDSPWYPTARLFRQTVARNWEGVLDQVERELQALVPESGGKRQSAEEQVLVRGQGFQRVHLAECPC